MECYFVKLRQLYYFRTLARLEHYTQAAAELAISQPSLSHAISELEKELDAYLFERKGRNVHLTKYGRMFLTYVENALEELEKGEKKLHQLTNPYTGIVDLGFIYTLGTDFVPKMIESFSKKEEFQNISFSFTQGDTRKMLQGLKDETFDLAFCSYIENETEIEFTPLAQQELVVIVQKNHPLAKYDHVSLQEVAPYPFIFFHKNSGLRPVIDALFEQENITPNIICEVEEDSAIAGLVSVNYGISIIPRISFLHYFDVKSLILKEPSYERYICLAKRKNAYLSPSAVNFQNFAVAYAKEKYLDAKRFI